MMPFSKEIRLQFFSVLLHFHSLSIVQYKHDVKNTHQHRNKPSLSPQRGLTKVEYDCWSEARQQIS